jgi:hypothetical protein
MSCGRHPRGRPLPITAAPSVLSPMPYFICVWAGDAPEVRSCAGRTQAWKPCEKLTHRRVEWLAKLSHL